MKKILVLLIFCGVLFSCDRSDDTENTELIGKWKLTEVLADPGDGSGTFHTVSSNKTIEFQPNGVITSSGSICEMLGETTIPSSGTYSLSDSTINGSDCPFDPLISPLKIRFRHKGSELQIYYPCIEGCIAKYVKL